MYFNLLEQDELIQLRKEVNELRMEREILKKAAVFFTKELQYNYYPTKSSG